MLCRRAFETDVGVGFEQLTEGYTRSFSSYINAILLLFIHATESRHRSQVKDLLSLSLGQPMNLLKEELEVIRVHKRRNAMAQVDDPALVSAMPIEAPDHLLDNLGDGLVGAIQDARVSVTLDDHGPVTDDLDGLRGVVQPVEANHVVAHVAGGVEGVPCALGEDDHGHGLETHLLQAKGQVLGDVSKVGRGEFLEGGGGELAGPGVKDLDDL